MTRAIASPAESWLQTGFAYIGICYYEQGIVHALRAGRGEQGLRPGETDAISTLIQLFVLTGLACILIRRWHRFLPLLRPMLPYLVITALCLCSTLWSDLPLQTLRRSTSLATCLLLGTTLYLTFGFERTVYMAAYCTVGLGVLSVLAYVAAPSIGHEVAQGYEGAMRGVFPQKNPMSQNMVLALACFAFRTIDRRRLTWPDLACAAVLLSCLVLGRSASSMICASLILIATAFMLLEGRRLPRVLFAFLVAWAMLAASLVLLLAPDIIAQLVGRDASLTGRVPLWNEVLDVIARRPLLGYGYSGFWNGDAPAVQSIWRTVGWRPPDSHNGYLDLMVQTGVVGVLCYAWLWGRVLRQAWTAHRRRELRMARWVLLFMLANLVLNLDEGPLAAPDSFTMLMPVALLGLAAWQDAARARLAAARLLAAPKLRFRSAPPEAA